MKTSEGVGAWIAYSTWIKLQGKKVPPQTSFLSSRFYQSFIKFAAFVQQVKTIDVEKYVGYMVRHDIPPVIWTHDAVYSEWIRCLTEERSPLKLVQSSCLFLITVAETKQIDVSEVFDNCTSPEVADWVQTGKVSPWLLLNSAVFKKWWAGLDPDDKQFLSNAIDPQKWLEKIKSNPNTIEKIKAIVQEMGI